jgi:hypothetical protein
MVPNNKSSDNPIEITLEKESGLGYYVTPSEDDQLEIETSNLGENSLMGMMILGIPRLNWKQPSPKTWRKVEFR